MLDAFGFKVGSCFKSVLSHPLIEQPEAGFYSASLCVRDEVVVWADDAAQGVKVLPPNPMPVFDSFVVEGEQPPQAFPLASMCATERITLKSYFYKRTKPVLVLNHTADGK